MHSCLLILSVFIQFSLYFSSMLPFCPYITGISVWRQRWEDVKSSELIAWNGKITKASRVFSRRDEAINVLVFVIFTFKTLNASIFVTLQPQKCTKIATTEKKKRKVITEQGRWSSRHYCFFSSGAPMASSMLSNFCSEESAWEKICEGTEEHRGNVLPASADSRA